MEYSEHALSLDERGRGIVLACRSQMWSDVVVRRLDSEDFVVHPSRVMRCRVVGIDNLTHDIVRLRLEIVAGGPFTFSAGQYAQLELPVAPGISRDYSMANRPDQPLLEFHVRVMPGGSVSHRIATALKVGDMVKVSGPMGTSYLRAQHPGPMLCIAGGSGLAPDQIHRRNCARLRLGQPVHLYFGVRSERDVYFERELPRLQQRHANFRAHIVLSDPGAASSSLDTLLPRRYGLVTDAVAADFAGLAGFKAYFAGPPPMVDAATALAKMRGVGARDIHADAFFPAAAGSAESGGGWMNPGQALAGRVAIVTGGARGIGLAIVEELHRLGAAVVVADSGVSISGSEPDSSVAESVAAKLGGNAARSRGTWPRTGAADQAVKLAVEKFGALDIVVNNAAILRDAFIFKASRENWEQVIGNNLTAAFALLAAATPLMRDQQKNGRAPGRIVNIVSSAGLFGNFGQSAYASAKAGLFGTDARGGDGHDAIESRVQRDRTVRRDPGDRNHPAGKRSASGVQGKGAEDPGALRCTPDLPCCARTRMTSPDNCSACAAGSYSCSPSRGRSRER